MQRHRGRRANPAQLKVCSPHRLKKNSRMYDIDGTCPVIFLNCVNVRCKSMSEDGKIISHIDTVIYTGMLLIQVKNLSRFC